MLTQYHGRMALGALRSRVCIVKDLRVLCTWGG